MNRVQVCMVVSSIVFLIVWLLMVNLQKMIHYNECKMIVTNNNFVNLSRETFYDNVLSVMSYNVNNLPTQLFINVDKRLEKLKEFLSSMTSKVDVFVFQEVFTKKYIDGLSDFFERNKWSVAHPDPKSNYLTFINSGLFIASRYEIKNIKGINFRDCDVFDCLAKKAAIRFSINEKGYIYNLIVTHLQDATFDLTGTIRKNQMKQIKNQLVESQTDAILGDLNVTPGDNIYKYGESLFGSVLFPNKYSFPSSNKTLDGTFGKKVSSVEIIDPGYDIYVSDHLPILVYISGTK